jgi:hypothetical protein
MTLAELIAECRIASRDIAEPPLVCDESFTRWANEAVQQACERAPMLWDATSSFCTVAVVANTASYTLDGVIRQIDDIRLRSTGEALAQLSATALQQAFGNRWTTDTGEPRCFIRNDRVIRLYPIPSVADSIDMSVYRLPLSTEYMVTEDDTPAIPVRFHNDLIYWMLHRFYLVDDADIAPQRGKSSEYFSLFESKFGVRPSARLERFRQDTGTELYQLPIMGVR